MHKKVENPNPKVKAVSGNGFVSEDKIIEPGTTIKFGFDATSNAETNEALDIFYVCITGDRNNSNIVFDTTYKLKGDKSFHCELEFTFEEYGRYEIVGRACDVTGEKGQETIKITVKMDEPFTWKQVGEGDVEGFGDYGLIWNDTIKEDTIVLFPADSLTKLLLLPTTAWDTIYTETHKHNLFADIKKKYFKSDYNSNKIDAYTNIVTNKESVTYNEILVVWNTEDEEKNTLLYIRNSFAENYHDEHHITIHGMIK